MRYSVYGSTASQTLKFQLMLNLKFISNILFDEWVSEKTGQDRDQVFIHWIWLHHVMDYFYQLIRFNSSWKIFNGTNYGWWSLLLTLNCTSKHRHLVFVHLVHGNVFPETVVNISWTCSIWNEPNLDNFFLHFFWLQKAFLSYSSPWPPTSFVKIFDLFYINTKGSWGAQRPKMCIQNFLCGNVRLKQHSIIQLNISVRTILILTTGRILRALTRGTWEHPASMHFHMHDLVWRTASKKVGNLSWHHFLLKE